MSFALTRVHQWCISSIAPTGRLVSYHCDTNSLPGQPELLSSVCSDIVLKDNHQCPAASKGDKVHVPLTPVEFLPPSPVLLAGWIHVHTSLSLVLHYDQRVRINCPYDRYYTKTSRVSFFWLASVLVTLTSLPISLSGPVLWPTVCFIVHRKLAIFRS